MPAVAPEFRQDVTWLHETIGEAAKNRTGIFDWVRISTTIDAATRPYVKYLARTNILLPALLTIAEHAYRDTSQDNYVGAFRALDKLLPKLLAHCAWDDFPKVAQDGLMKLATKMEDVALLVLKSGSEPGALEYLKTLGNARNPAEAGEPPQTNDPTRYKGRKLIDSLIRDAEAALKGHVADCVGCKMTAGSSCQSGEYLLDWYTFNYPTAPAVVAAGSRHLPLLTDWLLDDGYPTVRSIVIRGKHGSNDEGLIARWEKEYRLCKARLLHGALYRCTDDRSVSKAVENVAAIFGAREDFRAPLLEALAGLSAKLTYPSSNLKKLAAELDYRQRCVGDFQPNSISMRLPSSIGRPQPIMSAPIHLIDSGATPLPAISTEEATRALKTFDNRTSVADPQVRTIKGWELSFEHRVLDYLSANPSSADPGIVDLASEFLGEGPPLYGRSTDLWFELIDRYLEADGGNFGPIIDSIGTKKIPRRTISYVHFSGVERNQLERALRSDDGVLKSYGVGLALAVIRGCHASSWVPYRLVRLVTEKVSHGDTALRPVFFAMIQTTYLTTWRDVYSSLQVVAAANEQPLNDRIYFTHCVLDKCKQSHGLKPFAPQVELDRCFVDAVGKMAAGRANELKLSTLRACEPRIPDIRLRLLEEYVGSK